MAKRRKQKTKTTGRKASVAPRRKRRSRLALHYTFFILFGVAVVITLSLTVLFKIESITVTGSDKYTESEIIEASGILIEDNLFRVPAAEIEQMLCEQYPYIEAVRVHRLFPPAIEIQIEQSVPVAALEQNGEYILITEAGKVLERGLLLLTDDWLLVKGVNVLGREPGDMLGEYFAEPRPRDETDVEQGERLKRNEAAKASAEQETEALKMINYLFDAIDETGFEGLTNLDISNRLDMHIMYENRLLLKLGSEASLAAKLLFVRVVVTERLEPTAHGIINAADLAISDRLVYAPASGYNNDGSPIAHLGIEE